MPIHAACWKGHIAIVEELLKYLKEVDTQNNKHSTPLSLASASDHVDITRMLIERGANVNYRAKNGFTLLHTACNQGNLEIVKLLVVHNAQVNAIASEKTAYPIQIAVFKAYDEIVSFLIRHGSKLCTEDTSFLTLAVYNKHYKVVEVLLNAGANVHQTDKKYGQQAIHKAGSVSTEEILELLLVHKADVNATDDTGLTPLHLASVYNNYALAKTLLQHGANVETLSEKGSTPLKLAKDDLMRDILNGKDTPIPEEVKTPSAPPLYLSETIPQVLPTNANQSLRELEDLLKMKTDQLYELRNKCSDVESEMSELSKQITNLKANSLNVVVTDSRHLECPICFEVPLPPKKIFQCEQGHIFCEACKNQGIRYCPECRCSLEDKCIRNRRLEDVIRETCSS